MSLNEMLCSAHLEHLLDRMEVNDDGNFLHHISYSWNLIFSLAKQEQSGNKKIHWQFLGKYNTIDHKPSLNLNVKLSVLQQIYSKCDILIN